MFLVSQVFGLVKNSIFVIFSDTTNVMNVRPHNGTKRRALCVRYTFSDLDINPRSQQCQTASSENLMFLSDKLKLCRIVKYIE